MKRVLLTGMSGVGKSTVIRALARRGYRAVDTDTDEWSEWTTVENHPEWGDAVGEPDWIWREERIQALLAGADSEVLFVSGCKSNQGKFYAQFEAIILLTAPVPVLRERLASRTTNSYGQRPDELARILRHIEAVEPLLRRSATLVVEASAPVEQVVETILSHVRHT